MAIGLANPVRSSSGQGTAQNWSVLDESSREQPGGGETFTQVEIMADGIAGLASTGAALALKQILDAVDNHP
jgi:hypothetical protein